MLAAAWLLAAHSRAQKRGVLRVAVIHGHVVVRTLLMVLQVKLVKHLPPARAEGHTVTSLMGRRTMTSLMGETDSDVTSDGETE